jgi:hypothetical protein
MRKDGKIEKLGGDYISRPLARPRRLQRDAKNDLRGLCGNKKEERMTPEPNLNTEWPFKVIEYPRLNTSRQLSATNARRVRSLVSKQE